MKIVTIRGWSKEYKKMWESPTVNFATNEMLQSDGEWYVVDELLMPTGLKDKNGVEIYEGDIVCYQYPQKQLKNHQQLCTIIYEPKAAAFLLRSTYYEPQTKYLGDIVRSNKHYDTRTYELCEVIGNIYENKELLEAN